MPSYISSGLSQLYVDEESGLESCLPLKHSFAGIFLLGLEFFFSSTLHVLIKIIIIITICSKLISINKIRHVPAQEGEVIEVLQRDIVLIKTREYEPTIILLIIMLFNIILHIPESIWEFLDYGIHLEYLDPLFFLDSFHLGTFLSGISVFAHTANFVIYVIKIPSFRNVIKKNICDKCRRLLQSCYQEIVQDLENPVETPHEVYSLIESRL